MSRFEVQGIVSAETGLPSVQFRQLDDNDEVESGFQLDPAESRDLAQNILEAALNAVYDAAIISWAKERDPEDGEEIGVIIVDGVRRHRADKWGLPDRPEDWRSKDE